MIIFLKPFAQIKVKCHVSLVRKTWQQYMFCPSNYCCVYFTSKGEASYKDMVQSGPKSSSWTEVETSVTVYNHAFCNVRISFWRKAVTFNIFTVFHQIQHFSHCRLMYKLLVFLPVILWSCVTTRGPQHFFKSTSDSTVWTFIGFSWLTSGRQLERLVD